MDLISEHMPAMMEIEIMEMGAVQNAILNMGSGVKQMQ